MMSPGVPRQPKIWIDTDNALGADSGDVDDGFAIAAVLAADAQHADPESHRLLGLSAVAGNTDAVTAHQCNHELLSAAGATDSDCVEARGAAERIAALPNGTSILAIGPLTNVAAALRIDPQLLERTTVRIVATVHNRKRHPILPRFCLNVRHDPDAAATVFAAARAASPDHAGEHGLRIIPLDVAMRIRIGAKHLEQLKNGGPVGQYLAHHSTRWLKQSWWRYQSRSFPAWDLLAALDALNLAQAPRSEGWSLVDFEPTATWGRFASLVN